MLKFAANLQKLPEPFADVLRACRTHLITAALFSALTNILYLAPSLYMMQIYDRVIPTGGGLTLVYVTLVVTFALATLAALDQIRGRLLMRAGLRIDRMMAQPVMERLLGHPQPGQSPKLGQLMREFDQFRAGIAGPGALALLDAPWTPFYLFIAFLIHPLLGLFTTVAAVLLFILAILNERATKGPLEKAAEANSSAYAAQEILGAQGELVRALGMRRALVRRHLVERRRGLNLAMGAQMAGGRYSGLIKFLRLLLQSVALGLGAWLAINKQISAGSVIAASILLSRALQPVEQLVGGWRGVVQARTAFDHLLALFARTSAPDQPRTQLPAPQGRLALERIVVQAPGREDLLLRNLSLEALPGEVLGIIGPSGAGKTTLARVAAGGLIPDQGAVRLDGARFADWDSDALGRHIGYLPQDVGLMAGTVKENICRFQTAEDEAGVAALDAEAVAAAQAAGAHELILRLPKGYDTPLSAGGRGLSAGQGQRVALARALFNRPAVLILDEPNAYLDAEGEAALIGALRDAKARGAAILIVAHRAGVLAIADRLAVVRDGVLERLGPRDQVLAEMAAASKTPAPKTGVPFVAGADR